MMDRQTLINKANFRNGLALYNDFLYRYDSLMDLLIIVEYAHDNKVLDFDDFIVPEEFDCLACVLPFAEKIKNLNLNNIKYLLFPFSFNNLLNVETINCNKLVTGNILNSKYELLNEKYFLDKKTNTINETSPDLFNKNIYYVGSESYNSNFINEEDFTSIKNIKEISLKDIEQKMPEKSYITISQLIKSPKIKIIGVNFGEYSMNFIYEYNKKLFNVIYCFN